MFECATRYNAGMSVRLYLFGALRIESDAQTIHLPTRKLEALLAYLVLHSQTTHTREKLATLCWGDSTDAQARASLRNALPVLRRTLGNELFSIDRETVQLNPAAPLWVDVLAFQAQATAFLAAAFPDLKVTVHDQVAEGNMVATRMSFGGTHTATFQGIPPTGKAINVSGVIIDRIVDGKITEHWASFDAMGMMQQLGVIPTPG